jgi:hypothetical protein
LRSDSKCPEAVPFLHNGTVPEPRVFSHVFLMRPPSPPHFSASPNSKWFVRSVPRRRSRLSWLRVTSLRLPEPSVRFLCARRRSLSPPQFSAGRNSKSFVRSARRQRSRLSRRFSHACASRRCVRAPAQRACAGQAGGRIEGEPVGRGWGGSGAPRIATACRRWRRRVGWVRGEERGWVGGGVESVRPPCRRRGVQGSPLAVLCW